MRYRELQIAPMFIGRLFLVVPFLPTITFEMVSENRRQNLEKVCTRNDDLEDVISRTPPARREDLVFLQNGVLGPFLDKHGLAKNTQVC